jgi:lysophospholipase L1-like esterase
MEDVNPQANTIFQAGISALAADLAVPMFDFSTELRTDRSLWGDPLHLNAYGAKAFAPMLARSLEI